MKGDVYDLANPSIGIRTGNAVPAAQGRQAAGGGQRLPSAGGVVKKKDSGGCC